MPLTVEEVIALAPDDASAKAARGLVAPSKWPLLGACVAAAWGECQGSGAKPYQTQVDLSGPAFKCSCPSRKFPCKHGLALLLLRAEHGARFTATEPPAWVGEWLASRGEKAQKKEAVQADKAAAPVDPLAAAKRDSQRWKRIAGATQDLQRFLADQLARGIGSLDSNALKTWATMAARMVDAQAPGLGARLQEAAGRVRQGEHWPERTLQGLGLLQLACDAVARRESLSDACQSDLRTLAGWPHDQAEVTASGERVSDRWAVLGLVTEERANKLTERRVWLRGQRSGRWAWMLDHAFAGRGFEQSWFPGTAVEATLAFFPGAAPLRALAVERAEASMPDQAGAWLANASPMAANELQWHQVAERVAACPWTILHPLLLRDVAVDIDGDAPWLHQGESAWPLRLSDVDRWLLLACTGGASVTLAGEWDGDAIRPLAAWVDGGAPAWIKESP
ncbi:MAG: SWIM zinc finger family protein [Burkholderiaceae bacterium]